MIRRRLVWELLDASDNVIGRKDLSPIEHTLLSRPVAEMTEEYIRGLEEHVKLEKELRRRFRMKQRDLIVALWDRESVPLRELLEKLGYPPADSSPDTLLRLVARVNVKLRSLTEVLGFDLSIHRREDHFSLECNRNAQRGSSPSILH